MLKKSLALASLTLLLVTPITQVNASVSANTHTWHKGTPKALRGEWSWIKKNYDYAGGGGQYSSFVFTKSGFLYGEQGEPVTYTKHAKYRSLGHGVYKIHAYDYVEARKTQGT